MADLNVALLGFLGVLIGGYFNNFLAEDYKRFRDSQALAGALAGELESHAEAIPLIKLGLNGMLSTAASGADLNLPEWPVPASPVFDENAAKIGQLGPGLANGSAYVYENIRAFRNAFHLLSKNHGAMPVDWKVAIITNCINTIERAEKRGGPLIQHLKEHAAASYWKRPATIKQCVFVALFFATFMFGASLYGARAAATGTNCTTVFDHDKGTLHTVCK
ncbi:hypothetical protein [Burkholderia ubonensis]|uniref:hypothetical protein n=1 Tax=Burkholderia ubonensis TaxID=101571 RepID=UPI000757DD69|nr:hypothetical protein [Burkholderia ubonensis]KVW35340.1 hypothetical protein WK93_29525 [Burkholderia ubonensis]OJB24964.1 hypothetical protein BGV54_08050 [Burkholderia ubonensis]